MKRDGDNASKLYDRIMVLVFCTMYVPTSISIPIVLSKIWPG